MKAGDNLRAHYSNRRVLVFGAGGFLGRWLCRGLGLVGAQVVATVRPGGRRPQLTGEVAEFDAICGGGEVLSLLKKSNPDIVFNLISYGVRPSERDEVLSHSINVIFPHLLGQVLAEHHPLAPLIHLGSALEYGPVGGILSPKNAHQPHTLYGRDKLTCTRMLATQIDEGGLIGAVARPFTIYGPEDNTHKLLPSLLAGEKAGKRIFLSEGKQLRDFIFVGDVVRALLALAVNHKLAPSIVNLASGKFVSVRSFIEEVAKQLLMDDRFLDFGALPPRAEEMPAQGIELEGLRGRIGDFLWMPPKDGIAWTLKLERGGLDGWKVDPGWVLGQCPEGA